MAKHLASRTCAKAVPSSTDVAHGDLPSLVTEAALAKLLGVSRRKLQRDRNQGIGVPFVKVGRRVLYLRQDIIVFLEEHRFTSTAEAKRWRGL